MVLGELWSIDTTGGPLFADVAQDFPFYGFIESEQGLEVFVHYSAIQADGFRTLEEGDKVEFEVGAGRDGRTQAEGVRKM